MKQRITYLSKEQGGVDPARLKVGKDSITVPGLDAAKEWRVTLGVQDLPQEIWHVLKQSHELHIRWASPQHHESVTPFISRVPSGLHVFFTPRRDSTVDALCPLIKSLFGKELLCHSVKESFSSPPILSARFAMSSAFQYYQPLPSLDNFVAYVQREACSNEDVYCLEQLVALRSATSIDMDFDAISHALTINAFWAQAPRGDVWKETIKRSPTDSVEVGVLNREKPQTEEEEELSIGGFLTVLGHDEKPSTVLFSFPSRHHPMPDESRHLTFRTSFRQPTGLHPTLQLSFPAAHLTPPSESCALHAYLTLPSAVFIDRYQFSDPLFLASQNLTSLRSLSGETDLEAPVWVIKRWGSAALFELAQPPDTTSGIATTGKTVVDWAANIPLHLRYLSPLDSSEPHDDTPSSDQREIGVPWPIVFWACEAEEGLKMGTNPFDRVNLGYDGLFGPKTMFYHVPPAEAGGGRLMESLRVPVADAADTQNVSVGTAVAVLLGFAWVCWRLAKVWLSRGYGVAPVKGGAEEIKKKKP